MAPTDEQDTGQSPAEDAAAKDQPRQPQRRAQSGEPEFPRERVLDRTEGPRIAGVPHHIVVGALHGDKGKKFTRTQLEQKVKTFLEREVPTAEEGE